MVLFFLLRLWLPRNGVKRACRAERSGAAAKAGAGPGARPAPDPEVVAKPKRRTFTAEYKLRILLKPKPLRPTRRRRAALLRREGLVLLPSGHLAARAGRRHARGSDSAKARSKSKRNPLEEENQKLQRHNARLTEQLRKAEIIIDVQKKVAALLGRPIPKPDPEENS